MTDQNFLSQLNECITLAQEIETHPQAKEKFTQLHAKIQQDSPQMAELLQTLWQEVIAARRSAVFWQRLSESEKEMADQMLQSLTEARQNYLRLMQEM
jgi:seryl-tRNA(Sec) selenium transferase